MKVIFIFWHEIACVKMVDTVDIGPLLNQSNLLTKKICIDHLLSVLLIYEAKAMFWSFFFPYAIFADAVKNQFQKSLDASVALSA